MKPIILFLMLAISYSYSHGQNTNTTDLIASCCEEGGRCSGSAYCSACKNCTGCKHCAKNGGSCGVCSAGSSRTSSSNSRKSNSTTSSSRIKIVYSKETILTVTSTTLNLREGPSTKFKIIEKLSSGNVLIYLENIGGWLKVKVKESKTIGYVYYKYVIEKLV